MGASDQKMVSHFNSIFLLFISDKFYTNEKELCRDLAVVINAHILALAEAGNIDAQYLHISIS